MSSPKGLPSSSFTPLSFDATALIKCELSDDLLSRIAVSGSLRSSACRSAVWRLLLRCLPYESKDWKTSLTRSRQSYNTLKQKNLIDPHDDKFSQDPQLNNPLAPVEQNPWNTFFEDNDLRDIIGKDVSRTFPEIEFFQQDAIRQLMSDILLIYAKENSFVNYKQGMHEILAPLIFVIYSDIEAFNHAKEYDELKSLSMEEEDILNCLFMKEFIEHDSYNLFQSFMLEVSKWYEEPNLENVVKIKEPYMRVQDASPSSRLMEDLADIGCLLQEIDPTLAKHLSSLDIPPQLFGIRWLRLLFGRELPLNDLLFLWDVLLIDRPFTPLVKCVFVSLLVQIRYLLLPSDYGGCLQYLMRYPPIADIESFIKLARHYRNPKKNAKPTIKSNNFSHITVAGKSHPNKINRPLKHIETPDSSTPVIGKNSILIRDRSKTVSTPTSPRKGSINRMQITPRKMEDWGKEIQLMEEQVSCLQTKLNEQDMICCQISKALEECATNVRIAKSSEECVKLADLISEYSKMLLSRNLTPTCPPYKRNEIQNNPETRKGTRRESPKIYQNNEMVELTKRAQM